MGEGRGLKKRRVLPACAAVILSLALGACGLQGPQKTVAKELGLDVSGVNGISCFDSHGGFHGDGAACIALDFSDGKVLEQIESSSKWKKFPLDETVRALVYGISDDTGSVGPFLTDGDGEALVPDIRDGYYLLIDRMADPDLATGADILHRGAFNFTLGIYDADTDTLYFCKLDT